MTVTFAISTQYPDIRIAEYSGISPTTPLDVTAAASGTGTAANSGAVTTTNANDLLVGASQVQNVTTAAGSGYTKRLITSPNGDILEDRIVTAVGSYSATATIASGGWIMQMVGVSRRHRRRWRRRRTGYHAPDRVRHLAHRWFHAGWHSQCDG